MENSPRSEKITTNEELLNFMNSHKEKLAREIENLNSFEQSLDQAEQHQRQMKAEAEQKARRSGRRLPPSP